MEFEQFKDEVKKFLTLRLGRMKDAEVQAEELIDKYVIYFEYSYDYENEPEVCAEGIYLIDLYSKNPDSVPELVGLEGSCFELRQIARRHLTERKEALSRISLEFDNNMNDLKRTESDGSVHPV